MIFLIWFSVLTLVVVLYCRRVYSRFNNTGVKHLPYLPLIGNMWPAISRKHHFADMIQNIYKTFPEERFVGQYEFVNPTIFIRDIELVKQITIKDFDSFLDHRVFIDENNEPLFGRSLFSLKGQKWKDMRSTLSPAFTSSKIKVMVPFMVDVGNQMIAFLKTKLEKKGTNSLDIEIKDLSTRYASDVIASCAFGFKVDSMMDEDNEFYAMGKNISNFTFFQMLKIIGYSSIPLIMKTLKLKLFSDEIRCFFSTLVLGTMKNREENNIVRPDMIHLLMEAKKGTLSHEENIKDEDAGFATVEESSVGKSSSNRVWDDKDLIAQALLFFLAGFDTVATAMTFLLYELALNPDCQDKLAKEIKETEKKNGGFSYNSVQQMKYLDMVVSESLRKWPPAIATDRKVMNNYNLGKPNNEATEDFIVRKGEGVGIPIWGFHHDPEYFENPEKFDPERFSDENKHKINPHTYMPFGVGPRNCIGSRFALCEVKVMVYQLIQHMEVLPCEKTCIPARLSTDTFNLRLKGGHWLKIKERQ